MAYSASKIARIFSKTAVSSIDQDFLIDAAQKGLIPPLTEGRKSSWVPSDLPQIGEQFGFLKKPDKPVVATSFVTKGGVLKSSLVLNIARISALHNIKTCVVGLDMQGDITAALGHSSDLDGEESLDGALEKIGLIKGLPEVFFQQADPLDLLVETSLPNLFLIPETPELVTMEQSLTHKSRREYWLLDKVIAPLKTEFDLILLDASPNWNHLITNALVASDVLISPVECKINNFRNLKMFQSFIQEFKNDLKLKFEHLYVPTRFSKNRKLSQEILSWYQDHLPLCAKTPILESIQGEEASAMSLSIPEYSPNSDRALEMNQLMAEIWNLKAFENKSCSNTKAEPDRKEYIDGPFA